MSAVDQGEVFNLLSSSRRRQMLKYLNDAGAAKLREIAKLIAAVEEGCAIEELSDQDIRRVYISLYQYHLPEMEEAGIVVQTDDNGVELTEEADVPLAYLEFSPEQETSNGLLSTARGIVGGTSR